MNERETPEFWRERPIDGTVETVDTPEEYRALQAAVRLVLQNSQRGKILAVLLQMYSQDCYNPEEQSSLYFE